MMAWEPVADSPATRGLTAMIVFNGLQEYADCRLCRQVPDGEVVPAEIIGAWKVVASALPQGMSFEVFSALNIMHDWLDGMKGDTHATQ